MDYWLKLYVKFLKWEWYKDGNTKNIFLHLLLKANRLDGRWQGIEVKRSQHITSLKTLSDETGLSIAQVRVALAKLKKTKEITDESHSKFRLVTVLNYEQYQGSSKQNDKQVAIKSQTSSNQIATIEEGKNIEIKKERTNTDDFEIFWTLYPKKASKQTAARAWEKLKPKDKQLAIAALPAHINSLQWKKDAGQFIPHASTWLNQSRWLDEVVNFTPKIHAG